MMESHSFEEYDDSDNSRLLVQPSAGANLRERVPSPTVEIERTLRSESQDEKTLTVEEAMRLHPNWYHRLPGHARISDYVCYPQRVLAAYIRRLVGNFGGDFTLLMLSNYFLVKGVMHSMMYGAALPFFKNYLGMGGDRYQAYGTVAAAPWSLKALMGTFSDALPLFGYHKKPYIIISAVLGVIASLTLATFPFDASAAPFVALLFFFCHFEIALSDLLLEGKYAELMSLKPHTGSDVVTWVWWCVMVGSLLGSVCVGPLADKGMIKAIFAMMVPLAAQLILPVAMGFLPEKRLPRAKWGLQRDKISENRKTFTLALLMALGAVGLSLVNLFAPYAVVLAYALGSASVLSLLTFIFLPRTLAKCNFYLFLVSATYVHLGGALDYFYTADEECIKDAPHFSYTYYTTWSSIVQSVMGAVGVMLFQYFMSGWRFRTVFWLAILLRVFASVVDVIIIKRYNHLVGISDSTMYMLGYNMVYQIVITIELMPSVILTSKLCPKGMEATVYALLAGFQNFGMAISRSVGVFFIEFFNIKTTPPCDFTNLATMILVSHMTLPLLCIPLTFVLLPRERMTDKLDVDGELRSLHTPSMEGANGFTRLAQADDFEMDVRHT